MKMISMSIVCLALWSVIAAACNPTQLPVDCCPDSGSCIDPGSGDGDGDTDAETDTDTDTDTGTEPGDGGLGECMPQTCSSLAVGAGIWDDGCGASIDCGDWVDIDGGIYDMGSSMLGPQALPLHWVQVPTFRMWRTEVTMGQYSLCVSSGACTMPVDNAEDGFCHWGTGIGSLHPVNCVSWFQASQFCRWAGGRLPSEAEWEYAARSEGLDVVYPWGNVDATCSYAVMDDFSHGDGCSTASTFEVCEKPAGNTAQGLCDMAGNVMEWVEDDHHPWSDGDPGYDPDGDGLVNSPVDGSAWVDTPRAGTRMLRGGGYTHDANYVKSRRRTVHYAPWFEAPYVGFRCAAD